MLTYPFHWFKEVEGQGHALHSLVSLALSEKKIKLMPSLHLTGEHGERKIAPKISFLYKPAFEEELLPRAGRNRNECKQSSLGTETKILTESCDDFG